MTEKSTSNRLGTYLLLMAYTVPVGALQGAEDETHQGS